MSRKSLARQLLVLQLLIVLVLLGVVAMMSVSQARSGFRDAESRRMLRLAEDVAANPTMRAFLARPDQRRRVASFAESARALSAASYVVIAGPDLGVLTSADPARIGATLPVGDSTVVSGRSWVGVIDGTVVAHVPVIGDNGAIIGVVAAGAELPNTWQTVRHSTGDALFLLAVATGLGVLGSLRLAWWVKRQTLGLEPSEITGLVEHREAMLYGIKEGVVGLDQQNRVTLVNQQARTLLALPGDTVGRAVTDLGLDDRLVDVLSGRGQGPDQIGLRHGRFLVMNRMPIARDDRVLGSVVTLRDRTELVTLERELDVNRNVTETLRAQAHEFANRLHTIAGLIDLGESAEARRYVHRLSRCRDQWNAQVRARIADPAVGALLVAKASLAMEQNTGLRLSAGSRLHRVDEELSADLITVLGNLVDNSLDALREPRDDGRSERRDGPRHRWVEVDIRHTPAEIRLVVRDSGPGVAPEIVDEVFRHGFTTKAAVQGGQRGIGLALTRQICLRRGGRVTVCNAHGAVFTAVLPVSATPLPA